MAQAAQPTGYEIIVQDDILCFSILNDDEERHLKFIHDAMLIACAQLKDKISCFRPEHRNKVSAWSTSSFKLDPANYMQKTHDSRNRASRAFYKLLEIFEGVKELDVDRALPLHHHGRDAYASVHLCESPGGFVEATAWALWKGSLWCASACPSVQKYWATSLPGDMWTDSLNSDSHNLAMFDINDAGMVDSFVSSVISEMPNGVPLVTGDGGYEVSDKDRPFQEALMLPLITSQFNAALGLLCSGGVLVLKMFATDLPQTRDLIATMCGHFNTSLIAKPITSRKTNDERYFVGLGFFDDSATLFDDKMLRLWLLNHQTRFLINQFNALSATLHLASAIKKDGTSNVTDGNIEKAIADALSLSEHLKITR